MFAQDRLNMCCDAVAESIRRVINRAPGRGSPLRDDRGSAPVWPLVVTAALAGAVLGATLAIRAHGRASRVPWVFSAGCLALRGSSGLGCWLCP